MSAAPASGANRLGLLPDPTPTTASADEAKSSEASSISTMVATERLRTILPHRRIATFLPQQSALNREGTNQTPTTQPASPVAPPRASGDRTVPRCFTARKLRPVYPDFRICQEFRDRRNRSSTDWDTWRAHFAIRRNTRRLPTNSHQVLLWWCSLLVIPARDARSSRLPQA